MCIFCLCWTQNSPHMLVGLCLCPQRGSSNTNPVLCFPSHVEVCALLRVACVSPRFDVVAPTCQPSTGPAAPTPARLPRLSLGGARRPPAPPPCGAPSHLCTHSSQPTRQACSAVPRLSRCCSQLPVVPPAAEDPLRLSSL